MERRKTSSSFAQQTDKPPPFGKILIANRGEIACRIIKTAHKLGIKAVAVYSEADRGSLHVQLADEAVLIGPAPSMQSYLVIDKIIAAAKQTGSDAIAPGYGFLSEKQEFAEAVIAAGMKFIGPHPGAIAALGDKIASKKLAAAAKVTTVPGSAAALASDAEAIKMARQIGYPVILKASAGGGGKGMLVVRADEEMASALQKTRSEAKSSFADDRVFLEKYIDHPRHIEIQILGDKHGHVVYLGERECSLQRRHQKVIEEAPSPLLDEKTRRAMGEEAVALAQAVKYDSAGTVEFIVDANRNYYFLEMNTRLQVEHPVTEAVTGIDLVEGMIRVAAGEKLPFAQSDIKLKGWAIEARVYAEDPARNFLPSIGRLTRYTPPPARLFQAPFLAAGDAPSDDPLAAGIRIDSGVVEGSEISIYYDPMIAKLIAYGDTRDQARQRLADGLDGFTVVGLNHNIEFLSALNAHPQFAAGTMSTHTIGDSFPDGFEAPPPDQATHPDEFYGLLAVAALHNLDHEMKQLGYYLEDCHKLQMIPAQGHEIFNEKARLRSNWGLKGKKYVAWWGDKYIPITVNVSQENNAQIFAFDLAGKIFKLRGKIGKNHFDGTINGRNYRVSLRKNGLKLRLSRQGLALSTAILSPLAAELMQRMKLKAPPDSSKFLLSPMPGLLMDVKVAVGTEVKIGEPLAMVEAMKMENILRAERPGRVKKIPVAVGDSLAVDQIIMEFE
ncbi:MAG: acetyl/propionyl/methylcrotonyl-CoA carboxylase subunit alpha [Candidatus Symbiobacter sp.]|nr:acetyl/propionyl/methylcrotonyl-CoA carboxylase subunit alpha [Candidatus Symbiobacter sp.]